MTINRHRLARSANIPDSRDIRSIGVQRKTKSRATWKEESVNSNIRRAMTTASIQRPELSSPPAAHKYRKSRLLRTIAKELDPRRRASEEAIVL